MLNYFDLDPAAGAWDVIELPADEPAIPVTEFNPEVHKRRLESMDMDRKAWAAMTPEEHAAHMSRVAEVARIVLGANPEQTS